MKNILTIDFDIIMAPSIDLYNDGLNGKVWDKIEQNNLIAHLLNADNLHYQRLTNFLLFLTNKLNYKQIHFIASHEQIISFLNPNEKHVFVNIDHHHDLGYDKEKKDLNCGNWGLFIPQLQHYMWINNLTSTFPMDNQIKYQSCFLKDYDLNNLSIPDEVFICYSEPWIPTAHRPLFFLWMDLCNYLYGVHFNLNGGVD